MNSLLSRLDVTESQTLTMLADADAAQETASQNQLHFCAVTVLSHRAQKLALASAPFTTGCQGQS